MSLVSLLREDSKKALFEGDSKRLETLRFLLSLIEKKELSKEVGKMTQEDALAVLQTEMKKKKESQKMFLKGERPELADEVKKEIEILAIYLPEELTDEEVEKMAVKAVGELGAGAVFGSVMGKVMGEAKGRVTGDKVMTIVKKVLAQRG